MKKQLIISLVLVLGLTTIAQPSFAMKRSRVGHPVDHLSSAISSIVLLMKYYLGRQSGALNMDDPYYFQPNHITFVSQSGTDFDVHVDNLEALLRLSRTIAALLSDLASTDLSDGLALPGVNDAALYLLTQMARGAGHEDLLNYIRGLSDGEIAELKKQAELLDSKALKDLISQALDNPFTWLPFEVIQLILERVGPKSRSSCASVDKSLHSALVIVRKPLAQGGFGCTDTLPIVDRIKVGPWRHQRESPPSPVACGQTLYFVNTEEGTVLVIDTETLQVVTTIDLGFNGFNLQEPIVYGQMLLVVNTDKGRVSVIDTETNRVVGTLREPPLFLVHGQMCCLANYGDCNIFVFDINTLELYAHIDVGGELRDVVVHGQMLYVMKRNAVVGSGGPSGELTIDVIDFGGYLPGQS